MQVAEAFMAAIQAAERLGIKWSGDVRGCIEFAAPPYRIAINGDKAARKVSDGSECPGYGVSVSHESGWPVAIIVVNGGIFMADGEEGESERAFIEACDRVGPEEDR